MSDIDRLAEAIRNLAPRVPLDQQIWSARQVGEYLDVSARQVTERLSARPGFPEPFRLPSDQGKGPLRWWAKDIIAWARKLR